MKKDLNFKLKSMEHIFSAFLTLSQNLTNNDIKAHILLFFLFVLS